MTAPNLLAILNLSEDSFSNGGKFAAADRQTADKLSEYLKSLLSHGIGWADIGLESSNPFGQAVTIADQVRKLDWFFELSAGIGLQFSIDTSHPQVFRHALAKGARILNDIRALQDDELRTIAAEADCRVVLMHNRHAGRARVDASANSTELNPEGLEATLIEFFDRRLEACAHAGLRSERIILDPGMGFFLGTDPALSFKALALLPRLKKNYNMPVMAAVSRKSFLAGHENLPPDARGAATLACELWAARRQIDWIRTHDPVNLSRAIWAENSVR